MTTDSLQIETRNAFLLLVLSVAFGMIDHGILLDWLEYLTGVLQYGVL